MFGISEIAVILIVVILVLGAKKLPDLARSAGKSARILKSEARALKDQDRDRNQDEAKGEGHTTEPRVIKGETLPPK